MDSPAKAVADENGDLSTPINRFSLDTVIEDEGANLSIGQVVIKTFTGTPEPKC